MIQDILSALLSVAVALLVALPLGKTLKKCPMVFYTASVLLVAVYLGYRYSGVVVPQAQILADVMGKGYLSCALLAVVMFTGVLDEGGALRHRLQPVRAELSIMSLITIVGHVVAYLPSYLPRLGAVFSLRAGLATSFAVAALLLVIFVVLGVTSLHVVRAKMPRKAWKAIQRLSYLMVALLYVHVLLVLGRSAFAGHVSQTALAALVAYTAIVAAYAVLRVRKVLRDKARREDEAAS